MLTHLRSNALNALDALNALHAALHYTRYSMAHRANSGGGAADTPPPVAPRGQDGGAIVAGAAPGYQNWPVPNAQETNYDVGLSAFDRCVLK